MWCVRKKNGGYGAALRIYFETAMELEADRMVIIDSDGAHDPAEIPKLPEPQGVELVIGSWFKGRNALEYPCLQEGGDEGTGCWCCG